MNLPSNDEAVQGRAKVNASELIQGACHNQLVISLQQNTATSASKDLTPALQQELVQHACMCVLLKDALF